VAFFVRNGGFDLFLSIGDTAMGALRSVGYVAVVLAFVLGRGWLRHELRSAKVSPEHALLEKIQTAPEGVERQRLIAELEALPNKEVNFFYLWMTIHDAWQFEAWSDSGFDPSKVDLPRDIQLLTGAEFGVADIDNGGFIQFFGNDTGAFAPEMIEWFDRAGMPAGAEVLRKAVAKFGETYPRSQISRKKFLAKYARENTENPDLFVDLDGDFFEALEGKAGTNLGFEATADRWLRNTCGITKFSDPPSAAKAN
jgi:hypothetical protein